MHGAGHQMPRARKGLLMTCSPHSCAHLFSTMETAEGRQIWSVGQELGMPGVKVDLRRVRTFFMRAAGVPGRG